MVTSHLQPTGRTLAMTALGKDCVLVYLCHSKELCSFIQWIFVFVNIIGHTAATISTLDNERQCYTALNQRGSWEVQLHTFLTSVLHADQLLYNISHINQMFSIHNAYNKHLVVNRLPFLQLNLLTTCNCQNTTITTTTTSSHTN